MTRTAAVLAAFVILLLLWCPRASASSTTATAYGPGLFGNTMACGGTLNRDTIAVAAMPGMPCGTRVRICHRGVCARLRVRDRCPSCDASKRFDLSAGLIRRVWGFQTCAAWGVRSVSWSRW